MVSTSMLRVRLVYTKERCIVVCAVAFLDNVMLLLSLLLQLRT